MIEMHHADKKRYEFPTSEAFRPPVYTGEKDTEGVPRSSRMRWLLGVVDAESYAPGAYVPLYRLPILPEILVSEQDSNSFALAE